jgi:uncharacterized membrane protein YeaQ/YmgE (transglycosylase-associated protein family)
MLQRNNYLRRKSTAAAGGLLTESGHRPKLAGVVSAQSGASPCRGSKQGESMDAQSLIIWLVVGGIAGWLAGMVVKGGGYGLIGDIIVGIIGALIAGWLLPQLGIIIVGGFVGAIINAFIGAVILLIILRVIRRV